MTTPTIEPGESYLRTTPMNADAVWDLGLALHQIRKNWLAADQPDAKTALQKTFQIFADEYYEATGSRPCIVCGGEDCNCAVDDIDELQERLR